MNKVIFPGKAHNTALFDGKPPEYYLSRPNLLRNPTFRINRRGQDVYDQNNAPNFAYTVDGFRIGHSGENPEFEIHPIANGLHLKVTKGCSYFGIRQIIPQNDFGLQGQVITLSLEVKKMDTNFDFMCYNVNDVGGYSGLCHKLILQPGIASLTAQVPNDSKQLEVIMEIGSYNTCDVELSQIKLEIGNQFSGFHPLPYEMELLKCQRYYQVHSRGDIPAEELSPPMRINPRITQRPDGLWAYDAEV